MVIRVMWLYGMCVLEVGEWRIETCERVGWGGVRGGTECEERFFNTQKCVSGRGKGGRGRNLLNPHNVLTKDSAINSSGGIHARIYPNNGSD